MPTTKKRQKVRIPDEIEEQDEVTESESEYEEEEGTLEVETPESPQVSDEPKQELVEGLAAFDTTTWSTKLYYRCRKCFFGSFSRQDIAAHVADHVK